MVLGEDMTVMQVRPNYSIVYQFKPSIKFNKTLVKTKQDFVKHIKEVTLNWRDGDYFIRASKGTFCYMTLNGKRVSLQKKSKITGKEYLCWDYFSKPLNGKKKV